MVVGADDALSLTAIEPDAPTLDAAIQNDAGIAERPEAQVTSRTLVPMWNRLGQRSASRRPCILPALGANELPRLDVLGPDCGATLRSIPVPSPAN